MSNTIQVKRGSNASLPTLNAGEFGFSTDTHQVYVGDGATNHEIALVSKLTTTSGDLQTNIDGKSDVGHAHGDIYYTETEIDTWRASTTVTEMGYVHGVTSDVQTQLNAKADESITAVPSSNQTAEGLQCDDINAGESVTVINCIYLHSDGEWHKTNASAVATAEGMLAISLESKTDGQAMSVAMPGAFVRDDAWTWTVGQEIYLSAATAGALTQTAPNGANNVVRVIGHATHADRMFFNPDQTIVVHV